MLYCEHVWEYPIYILYLSNFLSQFAQWTFVARACSTQDLMVFSNRSRLVFSRQSLQSACAAPAVRNQIDYGRYGRYGRYERPWFDAQRDSLPIFAARLAPWARWKSWILKCLFFDRFWAVSQCFFCATNSQEKGEQPWSLLSCQTLVLRWKLDRKNITAGSYKWHADECARLSYSCLDFV